MLVKEFSIRVGREVREGSFHIASTLIFCFSMAFFITLLGIFINDNVRKIRVYEDIYHPETHIYALSISKSSQDLRKSALYSSNSNTSDHSRDGIAPETLSHSLSDEELLRRASMVPRNVDFPYPGTPRVAFLFLTRGILPLAPLWERFFKGHEGLFSIYIHTSPDYTYEPPQSSVFYKRRIPSKPVHWGTSTMIDAERRLLANALLNLSNQRFILLSETCIPLHNFTTIYNYLINSNQSFLGSFDDPRRAGRGRYNPKMLPNITLSDWRKGSQWFEINRKLAHEIILDVTYYPIFKNHCLPPCYMDEHYLPTLVMKIGAELTSNRSVTWTDWSRGGSHPTKFKKNNISKEFLNYLRYGFNCSYNDGMISICFLFARKFDSSCLQPVLRIAPNLLGFDN